MKLSNIFNHPVAVVASVLAVIVPPVLILEHLSNKPGSGKNPIALGWPDKNNPALEGRTVSETFNNGNYYIPRVYIKGSVLQSGKSYRAGGRSLTITGDVPAGTSI